jgi:hypothetical protein
LKRPLLSTRQRLIQSAFGAIVRPGLHDLLIQAKAELLEKEAKTAGLAPLRQVLEWSEYVRQRGAQPDLQSELLDIPQSIVLRRALRLMPANILGPHIPLDKIGDALHISELVHADGVILEASSIKPTTVGTFVSSFKKFPDIGACRVVTEGPQFSSRVLYDLIPAASASWTKEKETVERVPQFILSYLSAAYHYIEQKEWRTSIVLSAIALESLLAEMYENEFRLQAPGDPLGSLRYQIEQRFKNAKKGDPFPDDISGSIEACNEARISAVHRGGHEPSSKEAHGALSGAVRFSIWYLFREGKTASAISVS